MNLCQPSRWWSAAASSNLGVGKAMLIVHSGRVSDLYCYLDLCLCEWDMDSSPAEATGGTVVLMVVCENKTKQAGLWHTLRNCIFATAQAEAILHSLCPAHSGLQHAQSWRMQLFHKQAAHWVAKDQEARSTVPAGSRQAGGKPMWVLLLGLRFVCGQRAFSGFPKYHLS